MSQPRKNKPTGEGKPSQPAIPEDASPAAPPPNEPGDAPIAMRLEALMDSCNPDRPQHSIESDIAAYVRFLGKKYGVSVRHLNYNLKGREESVSAFVVLQRAPFPGESRTWAHSGGHAVAKWEKMP